MKTHALIFTLVLTFSPCATCSIKTLSFLRGRGLCTGGMQLPPVVCEHVVCTIWLWFVNIWAGLFQSTPCPCQSHTANVLWGRCPAMVGPVAGECVNCVCEYCPGKCPCGSRGPDQGVQRASRCPLWRHWKRNPPGPQTTRARTAGGYAHSTWPG